MIEEYNYPSPIGNLYIYVENDKLIALNVNKIYDNVVKKSAYKPIISHIFNYLDCYFNKKPVLVDFEINPEGTAFQKKVWQELLKIPYGGCCTYKDLAGKVFDKNPCAQAIGRAVSKNPILIIVPCHRVLGKDNMLVGFAAGLDIKRKLLTHENIFYKN